MNKNRHKEEPELNIPSITVSDLKTNKFSTPNNYFEELTPRIMDAVRASNSKEEKTARNWWRLLVPALGCAAVLITLWTLDLPKSEQTLNFDQVIANISLEELDEYADFESEELLAYEIVLTPTSLTEEISEEEMIDYLLNEDELEIDELYDELDI